MCDIADVAKVTVSEYIRENAWSEKDKKRLSEMRVDEVIEEMKAEMHSFNECPDCLVRGVNTGAEHDRECKFALWLQKERKRKCQH